MKLLSALIIATALGVLLVPQSQATEAAYVHIVKNETPDTRFHLGEVEAFANGAVPDELGGGSFDGQTTSTNDIGDGTLTTFGDGSLYPVLGTTTSLEHGGGNKNPDNATQGGGAVWSTANNLAENAQYTLDLGGTFDVTTVRMWPRADGCCTQRWQNLEIQLLDANADPIPGTQMLHTADAGNVALEFTYPPATAAVDDITLAPVITFPTESDPIVLSSAPVGTPVGTLTALTQFGSPVNGAVFTLVAGAGDTNNGSYSIGGPDNNQLLVNASLAGLDNAAHSVRLSADAGDGAGEKEITFTVKLDSDNDNLIDEWELMFGALSEFATGADADSDNLNDEDEFANGLDPSDPDADDDGSLDGDELANGTDPNNPDSDGDGLNDGDEATAGSDPLNGDTDGDGLGDNEEVTVHGTDPTLADSDGDGFSDPDELDFGSDPTNPASSPDVGEVLDLTGGIAAQSSQLGGFDAGRALDDIANFTHTLSSDPMSTWQVLLPEIHTFKVIEIFNREASDGTTGCCPSRLRDITIQVVQFEEGLDVATDFTGGTIVYSSPLLNPENAASPGGTGTTTGPVSLTAFPGGAVGNLIRVIRTKDDDNSGTGGAGNADEAGVLSLDLVTAGGNVGGSFGPGVIITDISHNADTSELSISWESGTGLLYNLRGESEPADAPDPLTWGILQADIEATPPINTITIPIDPGANPLTLFIVESFPAPPEKVYADDFENGQGGWTIVDESTGPGGTTWELGTPDGALFGGPPTAFSGSNAFGTDLDANYVEDTLIRLRSPAIDLSGVASATVIYRQWKDIEGTFDAGQVRILDAGDLSELAVLESDIDGSSTDWERVAKSVPAGALDKMVILEWTFDSDEFGNQAGWYLDDVCVTVP